MRRDLFSGAIGCAMDHPASPPLGARPLGVGAARPKGVGAARHHKRTFVVA